MGQIRLKIIGIFTLLLAGLWATPTHARIIFVDDVFENDSETYEIGANDDAAATTLTLEFGGTNAESLTWNTSIFTLSDDLTVQGNIIGTDITANGTLDANGVVTLGDGGDTVAIDSSAWDISAAGAASGFTGITSTGIIDFSGASRLALDQGASNPGTCTEGDIHYNTTDNNTYVCTATNTWTALGGGSTPDFEAVYTQDAGNNLDTSNGIFTVTTGTNDFVVDSNDWNVTAAGDLDAASVTSTGDGTFNDLVLSSFTQGSIPFVGAAGAIDEDNANLVWDDTNNRIGIGVTTPERAFHLDGDAMRFDRGSDTASLIIHRHDGGTPWKGFMFGVNASGVNDGEFIVSDLGTAVTGAGTNRLLINNTGDVGLGTDTPDEPLHVAEATDGDQVLGLFENSQANAAASTNETAQLRFGFGGNNDVARITAGKEQDYTAGGNEDSFLAFYTDLDGTATEAFRLDSNANATLSGTSITLDNDNAGGGANVDIVAEQGTDTNGTLRYDATDNRWKISNDGNAFRDIHMASVFYTYDNTGGQAINGTEITLNFDSVTETITDADYTFTDGADTVEFNEDGLYKITVEIGTDDTNTSGGARTSNEIRIQEDPLGVGSFADIPGGFTECYHRETTMNNCGLEIIRSFTATDEVRVRLIRTSGSTNMETQPQASHILIERIR